MSDLQLALTVLWTIELWAVQEITLDYTMWHSLWTLWINRCLRLALDLVAVGALVIGAPRLLLVPVMLVNLLFYGLALTFYGYFGRAISWHVLTANFGEGVAVSNAGVEMIEPWHFIFVGTCIAKLALLWLGAPHPDFPALRRFFRGLQLAGAWILLIALLLVIRKPMYPLRTWETVGGVAFLYGYLPAWAGEAYYVDPDAVRERAIERSRITSDRLAGAEPDLQVHDRVVFAQIESMDSALIDFRIGDREVTPRMNDLRDHSMFFRVRAPKIVGSCDTDFTALTARLSSADVPAYNIADYPWDAALPNRLAALGWDTAAVHGVSGFFFNRRPAYTEMGFADLFFREEFATRTSFDATGWTVQDRDLFMQIAERLAEAERPTFLLGITATSHMPFNFVPRDARPFHPHGTSAEDLYFDSMHYVDASIGELLDRVPPGTTLVVYGDHWSQIRRPDIGYDMEFYDGVGLVPFLVFDTDRDLAALQQTRGTPFAESGELELIDMMTWLHRSILAHAELPPLPVAQDDPAPAGEGSGEREPADLVARQGDSAAPEGPTQGSMESLGRSPTETRP